MAISRTTAGDDSMGAGEWVRARQARGRYTFTHAEAVAGLGRTALGVSKALRRLVLRGRLVAPRQRFYVVVPAEYDLAGAPPAQWFIEDLMTHIGQPYYVGLLAAAAQHGAAHQAAQVFQVVTDRPTRRIRAGRNRIEFVVKTDLASTPTLTVNTPTGSMRVSTSEATALDLVRYHKNTGYLSAVATVLSELAERLDAEELARTAAAAGYELSVVQRLGYLLDRVGAEAVTSELARLIAGSRPQAVPLRPDRPREGCPVDARWRVVVNEDVESDL